MNKLMIVDAVYTWVDGTDAKWQHIRRKTRLEFDLLDDSQEKGFNDRYVQHGELQLSLQCLKRFAPWIRRVHIITMDQVPLNLPEGLDIRIVNHLDILPADALPTFNSFAIETALHRIPDLAEHFIYFNDDMFLGAPALISDFFTENGTSVLPWIDNNVVQHSKKMENSYESALWFTAMLIANECGLKDAAYACRYPSHTVIPKTKRSILDAWAMFPDEMKRTEQSRFRSFNHVIHFVSNYIDIVKHRAVLKSGDARYFATDIDLKEHWGRNRSAPKFFCVNQVRTAEFHDIIKPIVEHVPVKIRRRRF